MSARGFTFQPNQAVAIQFSSCNMLSPWSYASLRRLPYNRMSFLWTLWLRVAIHCPPLPYNFASKDSPEIRQCGFRGTFWAGFSCAQTIVKGMLLGFRFARKAPQNMWWNILDEKRGPPMGNTLLRNTFIKYVPSHILGGFPCESLSCCWLAALPPPDSGGGPRGR